MKIPDKQLLQTKRFKALLIITLLGVIGGYAYYFYIGCRSGSCPINSNPWLSMIWGGLLGYIIADWIFPAKKVSIEPENKSDENQSS